jgi:peptidoglycan DL-endopeptidase LytF
MEFLKKYSLEAKDDGAVLTLYVSDFDTEFSTELGTELTTTRQDEICSYAKQRFPNIKFNTIKVVAGGILVCMFSLANRLQKKQTVYAPEPAQTILSTLTYTVKNGDSLRAIAKKFNLTTVELKNYNNLTSDRIRIGQIINLPLTKHSITSEDTLSNIAKNYGTSVDRIKQLNNLTRDDVYLGQSLYVPIASVAIKNPEAISEKGDS